MHSPYCPHGTEDALELYVQQALKVGLKEITFTEHMPLAGGFMDETFLADCAPNMEVMESYFNDVAALKEKYKKELKINSGLEVDYVDGLEEKTKKILNSLGSKLEDGILSVHFIKIANEYRCIDMSAEEFGQISKILGSIHK